MKTKILLMLVSSFLCIGNVCAQDVGPTKSDKIEGLTALNFPYMRGEKYLSDLSMVLICHLFNFDYTWKYFSSYGAEYVSSVPEMGIRKPRYNCSDEEIKHLVRNDMDAEYLDKKDVRDNLLSGKRPLIFMKSPLLEDEIMTAKKNGITVAYKPIGLDATLVINNKYNPVRDLTEEQVRQIYTGKVPNWKIVGGDSLKMNVAVDLDEDLTDIFYQQFIKEGDMVYEKRNEWTAIGAMFDGKRDRFPFYGLVISEDYGYIFYYQYIFRYVLFDRDWAPPAMKINGVSPTQESILDGSYPYSTNIYAAVNTGHPMAKKIYDYLTTAEGQQMLYDYGYIPLKKRTDGITDQPLPEVAPEIRYADGYLVARPMAVPQRIAVMDLNGKRLADVVVPAGVDRVAVTLQPGIYLVKVVPEKGRPAVIKITVTR